MQSLQDKASEWSGVAAADAFAIDDVNIFEYLGGTPQPFVDLSTNFYTRVYEDEEEWFREIFGGSKKEDAIQNQYEFLIQRMGGPPLFSQRRGHPALIGRHRPFLVTHRAAERWLHHMQQALDATESIDVDSKTKMMNFFRHTAYFLVAGNEMTRQQGHGVACKHATMCLYSIPYTMELKQPPHSKKQWY
uniref:Two-on-two hemoglobin-3 n=1 Tax=Zea mays TaxID=4577 RepID=A0A804R6R0_MAIZE